MGFPSLLQSLYLALSLLPLRSVAVQFSSLLVSVTSVIQYLKLRRQPLVEWPILRNFPSLVCNIHRFNDWITEIFRDLGCGTFVFNGPVFTGMEIVCTCDPQNVEYMMKTNFTNFDKGPNFAEIFDFLGAGIFNADGECWFMQRKMAISRFISKRFQSFYVEKNHEVVREGLLPVLQNAVLRGLTLDLQEVFKRLSFDSTCASVLGRNPGFLSVTFMENGFSTALDTATRVTFLRHSVPSFLWKTMRLLGFGWERKYSQAWQALDDHLARYVSLKKQDLADGQASDDLLSAYMRYRGGDKKVEEEKFFQSMGTERFLRDTALTFIFAGQDTISSGLTWFFWLLSKSPSVEANILEELKLVMFKEKTPDAGRKPPLLTSADELKNLNYLEAAILESMRLNPPIPIEHKGAKKEDVLPDGTVVRPGMIILYSLYSMGRMDWIWGDDCLDFKPERWIDEKGKLINESASRYPVFNVGPRACLGKRMALTIMKMVIAAILLNYHVEVAEGQSISQVPSVILKMKKGLKVTVTDRKDLFS